ncbi:MAG: hypothetical protein IIT60_01780 [Muribaculaceae bacterium]|nr:hypothetical protein [Muribaculaceae bacterium]MBQ2490305.1 hypothetical protein [Muribaculaceae bacterium]MBQ3961387.1 hypothetical protein [Muribaculaceae bacterium]MBQ4008531.1 hypothetical protein [Muribaculaceae bacterium]MBQ5465959.1 hypothetical protein [Muribaculaceae bacterium]
MKWISNYVFVAGERLKNHLVEIDADSRLIQVSSLLDELANTEYVPHALCVVSRRRRRRLVSLFNHAASLEDFEQQFARAFADDDNRKGRVLVAVIDFEAMRLNFLN